MSFAITIGQGVSFLKHAFFKDSLLCNSSKSLSDSYKSGGLSSEARFESVLQKRDPLSTNHYILQEILEGCNDLC